MLSDSYQQALAITVAGVLFFAGSVLADGNTALYLARQLYDEGDWEHAHTEAVRSQYHGNTNSPESSAIMHLAALRQRPSGAGQQHALQNWLATHADHPLRDWVIAEKATIIHAAEPPRRTMTGWFAQVIIRFYQTQIGPALGQRCAMYPSCSHYSLEACRRYGLAGIPMTADRIIRESDHIRYRLNPIRLHGRELYYDPVQHHSYWFWRYRK